VVGEHLDGEPGILSTEIGARVDGIGTPISSKNAGR
jgi:hypothetical protein